MRELNDVLRGKAQRIKLVAMDVDGVLTDGGMYYSESGSEMKKFHSRDGMGIKLLQRLDIITALITSENTKLVQRRADRLAIPEVHQGTFEKDIIIQKLCKKYSILMEDVAFIGDDVNDEYFQSELGKALQSLRDELFVIELRPDQTFDLPKCGRLTITNMTDRTRIICIIDLI